MFAHILLPTDGSALSEAAVQNGIGLAKSLGAKVTAFHVRPEFHLFTMQPEMLEDTREQFERDTETRAKQILGLVEERARKAGVPCDTTSVTSDHPYEVIIRAAQEKNCDLIVMASHGRRGVQAFLLGSETLKVLTHSRIPVLVTR